MDNQMSIGVVHIVEWLNPGDAETGKSLFKELRPIGAAFDPKVEIDVHRIESAGQLLGLLLVFTDKYRIDKRTPLLHLESHGTQDGIAARGQEITWRDFAEALVPLNRATGMNVVVNLAACWGFYGTTMLRPAFGPAPFRGLIGPNRKVYEAEVLKACLAFYRTIFDKRDGDAALKAMNDAVSTTEETFWNVGAELAFKLAFQGYMLRGEGSLDGAAARAEEFVTRRAARVAALRGAPVPEQEVAEWRDRARAFLLNHEARFDLEWRKFFYIARFRRTRSGSHSRSTTAGPRRSLQTDTVADLRLRATKKIPQPPRWPNMTDASSPKLPPKQHRFPPRPFARQRTKRFASRQRGGCAALIASPSLPINAVV